MVDLVTQVLSGLVAAHEKGIVHRDIKPENVFLTKRVGCPPVAKLVDFGVSKIIAAQRAESDDQELDLTRTGIVLGTPYYLAPEQARGDRNLDARVDLYAAGVVLYEALTGRRPYTASNYNALLINILTKSPRPARELRPELPAAFDNVLRKAMAREPYDRYQTAVEFQRIRSESSGKRVPRRARLRPCPWPPAPRRRRYRRRRRPRLRPGAPTRPFPSSTRPAATPRPSAPVFRRTLRFRRRSHRLRPREQRHPCSFRGRQGLRRFPRVLPVRSPFPGPVRRRSPVGLPKALTTCLRRSRRPTRFGTALRSKSMTPRR